MWTRKLVNIHSDLLLHQMGTPPAGLGENAGFSFIRVPWAWSALASLCCRDAHQLAHILRFSSLVYLKCEARPDTSVVFLNQPQPWWVCTVLKHGESVLSSPIRRLCQERTTLAWQLSLPPPQPTANGHTDTTYDRQKKPKRESEDTFSALRRLKTLTRPERSSLLHGTVGSAVSGSPWSGAGLSELFSSDPFSTIVYVQPWTRPGHTAAGSVLRYVCSVNRDHDTWNWCLDTARDQSGPTETIQLAPSVKSVKYSASVTRRFYSLISVFCLI